MYTPLTDLGIYERNEGALAPALHSSLFAEVCFSVQELQHFWNSSFVLE